MEKFKSGWSVVVIATIALVAAVVCAVFTYVNRPPRIGYAETPILMTEFIEAGKAKKAFEAAQAEWDKHLKALNDSLLAAMETMKKDYDAANPKEKEQLRELLERRNSELHRYTNAVKKMSQEKERELMDPVVKKINGFLTQWGAQNGYDLILGTISGGNILQANPGLNVTAALLKDINAHYAEPGGRGVSGDTVGKAAVVPDNQQQQVVGKQSTNGADAIVSFGSAQ